nr:hypothetical protein [Tanacetum cinerariifolium]
MAPLTFADTHNMVAFLSKSVSSQGFDQIIDFLNAHTIQYAFVVTPTIYVSCIKQFWSTTTIKKLNDVVQLRALIDGKKVIVIEDVLRKDLHLDDADGVECLPNEEIFAELARMGYKKPHPKLTFYKAFFSTQWKFLIHTLVQYVSAKRTVWNEFSYSMASAVICLAIELERVFQELRLLCLLQCWFNHNHKLQKKKRLKYLLLLPSSLNNAPSPPPQDPTPTPHATPPASPPQEQPSLPHESSMSLLNTLMETCASLSKKVAELEQDKNTQALEILKLKKRVKKLEKKKRSKSLGFKRLRKIGTSQRVESSSDTVVDVETQDEEVAAMDAEPQRRINQEDVNAANKGVSDVEPTIFDDEEVTMTMAQTLIKLKAEKAKLLDE